MKKPALLALFCLLPLAACSPATETGTQLKEIVMAEKGAYAAEKCLVPGDLIGQPHNVLESKKFTVPIRVIFPGDPVTSDHVANRLNFSVDKKGIIRDIRCG